MYRDTIHSNNTPTKTSEPPPNIQFLDPPIVLIFSKKCHGRSAIKNALNTALSRSSWCFCVRLPSTKQFKYLFDKLNQSNFNLIVYLPQFKLANQRLYPYQDKPRFEWIFFLYRKCPDVSWETAVVHRIVWMIETNKSSDEQILFSN